jgi:hypothetical protein
MKARQASELNISMYLRTLGERRLIKKSIRVWAFKPTETDAPKKTIQIMVNLANSSAQK